MKSLWHLNANQSVIQEKFENEKPDLQKVRTLFSMISTGTERLIAKGAVSDFFKTKMSVPYMEGSFDFPIKYGYSLVGLTEKDELVHVMHPHQDKVEVEADDLFMINPKLPPNRAVLISNMETVINAIWDAVPQKEDKIAICGFGNIGSLLANTLRIHHNLEVDIIESDDWRRTKANELEWTISDAENYDLIFHTSSNANGLQYCLDHLNYEGRLIELSWYGDKKVELILGKNFHYNRLSIISSQVSTIPMKMRNEHNYRTRKELAAKLLLDDSYDRLITSVIPFKETPNFFNNLRTNQQGNGLIWIIEYE